ncbi:MAG: hypothetical protein Fur0012_10710 [Elusimicrobiota bacterium]
MKNIMNWPKDFYSFLLEAYSELTKVNWLTRKDVIRATIGVFFVCLIVALYVGLVDFALGKLLGAILGGR